MRSDGGGYSDCCFDVTAGHPAISTQEIQLYTSLVSATVCIFSNDKNHIFLKLSYN